MSKECLNHEEVLRSHGFRATKGRTALLALLEKAEAPLSVQNIQHLWHSKNRLDTATLYRTLTDLTKAGVLDRLDLNSGTAHFEIAGRPHHHHIVCTGCGDVEDIAVCGSALERSAERLSKRFNTIKSHSLEFFGMCKHCIISSSHI